MSCTPKANSSGYSSLGRYSRYSPSGYNTYTNKGWCDGDVCEFHDQCSSNLCNDEGFCVGNGGDENSVLGLILSLVLSACFCLTCCMVIVICLRRVKKKEKKEKLHIHPN